MESRIDSVRFAFTFNIYMITPKTTNFLSQFLTSISLKLLTLSAQKSISEPLL